jgi:glycosyltransferase involved in cell wall biosynthesis
VIDVLLVRYCPTAEHEGAFGSTVAALERLPEVRVRVHDNTVDNIGLSRARNRLLAEATADVVALMDFDLSWHRLDFAAMAVVAASPGVGLVVPRSPGFDKAIGARSWQPVARCACQCMVMARGLLADLGGLDERYFVAYADWDLLSRVEARGLSLLQHNGSTITEHAGLSGRLPGKKEIWRRDRALYDEAWPGKTWS